jgi:hypothetical protein
MEPASREATPNPTRRPRPTRDLPPVGRFLALFATLLTVSLALAALAPAGPGDAAPPPISQDSGG